MPLIFGSILTGIWAPFFAKAAETPKPVTIVYDVSIAHIPIGTARFSQSFKGSTYHLHLSAEFAGLVRMFFAPDMSADAEGIDTGNRLIGRHYALTVNHPDDPQRVDMKMADGNVVDAVLDPPLPERADRVPVLPEHKKGIIDPLSGFLIPIPQAKAMSASQCDHVIPVFDGAGRFDITLLPDRDETFEAKGYKGPAVHCLVRYTAISGHRAKKTNVTYMENNRDIMVTLAPLPGRPYFVPLEISVATLIGNLRLTAETVDGLMPQIQDAANP
jgi:Protein of unknown function (DUF3108)